MNKNILISSLSKKTQDALFLNAQSIELSLSQDICLADKPIKYIYFPIDGFISITQNVDEKSLIEIGMIGREGMLGAEVVLGVNVHPFNGLIQGAGNALRIYTQDFMNEIEKNAELKIAIKKYLLIRIQQLGLSVGCEHFHSISARLAKWLLMSEDRAQSSTFQMTHEFISLMLGVRRVGVTTTAADFKRRGIIEYHRGEMKVLDRTALKAEACSCYQENIKIYSHLIN
jgi:CRP-like cAMP-binding protein